MSIPWPEKKNLLRSLHVLHPPNHRCWFAGALHSLTIFRSEFGYVKRRYTSKTLVLFLFAGPVKEIKSVLPCFGWDAVHFDLVGGCRFGGYTRCVIYCITILNGWDCRYTSEWLSLRMTSFDIFCSAKVCST